jgi:hypothetical protein
MKKIETRNGKETARLCPPNEFVLFLSLASLQHAYFNHIGLCEPGFCRRLILSFVLTRVFLYQAKSEETTLLNPVPPGGFVDPEVVLEAIKPGYICT